MNLLKTGALHEPASKGFSLHEPEDSFHEPEDSLHEPAFAYF